MRSLLLVPFLLTACAGMPLDGSSGSPASGSGSNVPEQAESETGGGPAAAVRELVASSRTSRARGDYAHALADVERAIRIQPRNPYLWVELGENYLAGDDPRQAAAMARKAASVAGSDGAAKAAAEELLERAARH